MTRARSARVTRRAARCGALALVLAWWVTAAHASSVLDTSLARMLELAEIGAYGEIADVRQVREDDVSRTEIDLEVERLLIGEREEDAGPLTLSFLGDVAGEAAPWIEDVPRPEVGARVLILAYDDPELASPIVGVWQAWWRLGPEGLSDVRDRRLTPTDAGVRRDGEGGPVDEVLDLLAEGTTAPPETDPDPAAPAEADAEADAESDAESDADGDGDGDGKGEPDAAREDAEGARPEGNQEARQEESSADPSAESDPEASDAEASDAEASDADTPDVVVRLRPPDDDGLQRALEDATQAWRSAGAPMRLVFDDEARDVVRPGPAAWFSPGALSLSRRAEGGRGVEVLLRPGSEGRRSDVLAYELGRLAGAPRLQQGVLSGVLPRDGELEPGPQDAAALRDAAERIPGDFDGDGVVDLYDLARLAERYGETGTRMPEDLDGSGAIDDGDLRILRESYQFLPPAREPPDTD